MKIRTWCYYSILDTDKDRFSELEDKSEESRKKHKEEKGLKIQKTGQAHGR